MTIKFNIRKAGLGIVFIILLFISCLELLSDIPMIQFFLKHIDEMLTLFLLMYVMYHYKTAMKINYKIFMLWVGITFIGLLSNVIFQYQNIQAVLIDAIVICPRFLLGYFATGIYLRVHNIQISVTLEKIAKVVVVVLFALSVHDILFVPFFPKSEYRYFMYAIVLMFPHVTYLACAAATMLIVFGYKDKGYKNVPYMIMASFLCLITLRSKAVGFVLLYWLAFFFFQVFKKRHFALVGGVGIIAAIFVAWDNIAMTFLISERFSPRSIMLKDGLSLLIKHFPFGTGFGTYGSAMAAQYYSPLYLSLGYENYRGMNPEDTMFLMDSFWPIIFGQFGIIGTLLFIAIIVIFVKTCIKKIKADRKAGMAMLMIIVYMLVASIAEAAFFSPTALLLFMLFSIFEKGK